jgi:hypothetical protein
MTGEHSSRPAVRKGFVRFSGGQLDYKWDTVPIGTEIVGTWIGWKPSLDPTWNPLGLVRVDGVVKVMPLPTALRILMRVPVNTEVVITYCGKKKGKRGTAFHDFDYQFAEGTVLLPEPKSADPDAVPS